MRGGSTGRRGDWAARPGAGPRLLAASADLEADIGLDEPDRPVHVALRHRAVHRGCRRLTGDTDALTLRSGSPTLRRLRRWIRSRCGAALCWTCTLDGRRHPTMTADGMIGIAGGQPQARAWSATMAGSPCGGVARQRPEAVAPEVHGRAGPSRRAGGSRRTCRFGMVAGGTILLPRNRDWEASSRPPARSPARPLQHHGRRRQRGGAGMSSGTLTCASRASGYRGAPAAGSRRWRSSRRPRRTGGDAAAGGRRARDRHRARGLEEPDAGGALQLPAATMVPVGNLHMAMTRPPTSTPLWAGRSPAVCGPRSRRPTARPWMPGSTPRGCSSGDLAERCKQPHEVPSKRWM